MGGHILRHGVHAGHVVVHPSDGEKDRADADEQLLWQGCTEAREEDATEGAESQRGHPVPAVPGGILRYVGDRHHLEGLPESGEGALVRPCAQRRYMHANPGTSQLYCLYKATVSEISGGQPSSQICIGVPKIQWQHLPP